MNTFVQQLTRSLFWDVELDSLDDEKDKMFIIQRVLERGSRNDWLLIKERYTLRGIVDEALKMRSLEPKALAYISCVSEVPKERFRCYKNKL